MNSDYRPLGGLLLLGGLGVAILGQDKGSDGIAIVGGLSMVAGLLTLWGGNRR